jgi:hypothetical protein
MKLIDIKPLNEMTYSDAKNMELVLAKMLKDHLGVRFSPRKHVRNRLIDHDSEHGRDEYDSNQAARDVHVEPEDIVNVFRKLIPNKRGKIMGFKQKGADKEFTVIDRENNLNIVFKIDFSMRGAPPEFALVTIMKKKGFKPKPTDTVFYV